MRRMLAIGLLVVAVVALLVVGTGATKSSDSGSYEVRAIFDNAGYVVTGEDVKVAGAVVGAVKALDVTRDHRAVVVLGIDDPGFKDFKKDATCTIRPQSLIGENYVECNPTAPKSANDPPAPALQKIRSGSGKGQYLLPLSQTSSPVGIDLIGDVMRLPERQRFALILNELGTGLAGNGQGLHDVVRRADPALAQTDRVLDILASQNQTIANLAHDSDVDLAPLARERDRFTDFIDKAGVSAQATAERGDALEQDFQRFPEFLRQLDPTVQRLSNLADQATPVFTDLRSAAPSINQLFTELGPFSTAALPAVKTLGDTADVGSKALPAADPVLKTANKLATTVQPVAGQLAEALQSLQQNQGFRRLMDFVVYSVGTLNGFDSTSHYLRALIQLGSCQTFNPSRHVNTNCDSTFDNGRAAADDGTSASAASIGTTGTAPTTTTTPPATTTTPTAPPTTPMASTGDVASGDGPATDDAPKMSEAAQQSMLGYLLGDGSSR